MQHTATDLRVPDRVAALTAVSLDELNDAAALQQRVDRKYIVGGNDLLALLDGLGHRLASLDIDGVRSFHYESTYFDTPALDCFRDAAHRRRHRFKIRTRTYVDAETTMLEIKTRGRRELTVKQRQSHQFVGRTRLDAGASDFIDGTLGRANLASTLVPTLTTAYLRTTLVDLDDIARVTIDADLRCTDWLGRSLTLPGAYIVETKSGAAPSVVDRHLWSVGRRPDKISKYGTGLAALHPELPSNKWHRTLKRHVRPSPAASARRRTDEIE